MSQPLAFALECSHQELGLPRPVRGKGVGQEWLPYGPQFQSEQILYTAVRTT